MEQLLRKNPTTHKPKMEKVEVSTKVTIGLMEEHLVQSAKVQMMIQEFMATLERDMNTLMENSSPPPLKEILYRMIISLDGQYKVWEAYVKDKGHE
jgi:hypothetical protein